MLANCFILISSLCETLVLDVRVIVKDDAMSACGGSSSQSQMFGHVGDLEGHGADTSTFSAHRDTKFVPWLAMMAPLAVR